MGCAVEEVVPSSLIAGDHVLDELLSVDELHSRRIERSLRQDASKRWAVLPASRQTAIWLQARSSGQRGDSIGDAEPAGSSTKRTKPALAKRGKLERKMQ